MKLAAKDLALLNWGTVSKAADDIKHVCADMVYVAPDNTTNIMAKIQRVADCLNAIADALHMGIK